MDLDEKIIKTTYTWSLHNILWALLTVLGLTVPLVSLRISFPSPQTDGYIFFQLVAVGIVAVGSYLVGYFTPHKTLSNYLPSWLKWGKNVKA